MKQIWNTTFDNYGVKTVTRTDKLKNAYVLNKQQLSVIAAAGLVPAPERPAPVTHSLTVLFDPSRLNVNFSYYHAERESSKRPRPAEPRLGREIITSWMAEGDSILLGNIGTQLFAAKISRAMPKDPHWIEQEVIRNVSPTAILARANRASKGKPASREVRRIDFVRNPYVVAGALLRANGQCEMPGCKRSLFNKVDGSVYLEVHHVLPLGEGGEDVMENVAALCPHCHREQHFGIVKALRRKVLATHVHELQKKET